SPTDPRRIDEHDLAASPLQRRVDRVASRTGNLRHDRALLPEELVEKARLAYIRTAHEGDCRRLVVGCSRERGVPPSGGRLLVDEVNPVGLGDGQPGLLLDGSFDRVAGRGLKPAGVYDHEPAAVPFGLAVQPVTGRPRAVLDDRRARAEDPIEKRGLADIWAT